MTRLITPDSTDQSIIIHLSTTTGDNATGKVAADLTHRYRRGGQGALTTAALSDLALITSEHSDGGLKEIRLGSYRLDLKDSIIADGVDYVEVYLSGSGVVQTGGACVIDLWHANKLNRQPRQNNPAGRAFSRSVSNRADGTHKVTAPVRVRVGTIGSIAVSIDMRPLFGNDHVKTVGTPTVSPSGTLTATATGPRDTEAMVTLGGTATASSTYTVTMPVTMDTGESVSVDFDVEVFAD